MSMRPAKGAVIVAGVPGVGKGDTLKRVFTTGQTVINFGDLMVELSGCESRDEMRAKLSLEEQKGLQQTVWFSIGDMSSTGLVLVDTHVSIAQRDGSYMPGIPAGVPRVIGLRGLVLCEADPADIARRSAGDQTRDRGNPQHRSDR